MKVRVFVISLKGAEERRAQIKSQMEWADIPFSFFDGLSGDEGFDAIFDGCDELQYIIHTGRLPTAGEIGCFASHRAVWKLCIELDEPIMIMEDDAWIHDRFPEAYRETARLIKQFGFIRLQSESRARGCKVADTGRFSVHCYTKPPHSLACYALTPCVATSLALRSKIVRAPADIFVKRYWEHGERLYGLQPYTVSESALSATSCIGSRPKLNKDLPLRAARLFGKLREGARRAWFNLRSDPLPVSEDE